MWRPAVKARAPSLLASSPARLLSCMRTSRNERCVRRSSQAFTPSLPGDAGLSKLSGTWYSSSIGRNLQRSLFFALAVAVELTVDLRDLLHPGPPLVVLQLQYFDARPV